MKWRDAGQFAKKGNVVKGNGVQPASPPLLLLLLVTSAVDTDGPVNCALNHFASWLLDAAASIQPTRPSLAQCSDANSSSRVSDG